VAVIVGMASAGFVYGISGGLGLWWRAAVTGAVAAVVTLLMIVVLPGATESDAHERQSATKLAPHHLALAIPGYLSLQIRGLDWAWWLLCLRPMRLPYATVVVALPAVLGCEPPHCETVGPPYAFHVTLHYPGGIRDLNVALSSDSGDDYLPALAAWGTAGHVVQLDVEWGGAEPDGSIGTFEAFAWGSALGTAYVERELTSVLDDEGCPVTQHETASFVGL
jgi:hypothetical protein